MPVFDFVSEDGETIAILVPITAPDKDRHEQVQNGKVYKRVYAAPLAAHDTLRSDATAADFKRVTEGKNVTMGQLFDISKEMSEQRKEKQGHDPVQERFYRNYEREFKTKHADEKKAIAREKMRKEWGIKVED